MTIALLVLTILSGYGAGAGFGWSVAREADADSWLSGWSAVFWPVTVPALLVFLWHHRRREKRFIKEAEHRQLLREAEASLKQDEFTRLEALYEREKRKFSNAWTNTSRLTSCEGNLSPSHDERSLGR